MPRIVLLYPDVLGGVNTYVNNLASFFRKKEINYFLIAYGTCKGVNTIKRQEDAAYSMTLHVSAYASIRSIYKDLVNLIKPEDILVCNYSLELEAINYHGLANRTLFIMHGDLVHYHSTLIRYQGLIDWVCCVSEGLKEKYSALFPSIPFSVNYPLIANGNSVAGLKQREPLKGIYIGRFEYMKGADDFIKVVEAISDKNIPMEWEVYAPRHGSDLDLLSKLSSEIPVFFDTANSAVLSALEKVDLIVFPSRSEGFGIVVLESMKRGVVPIVRNLPIGIPDMVKNNETGFLADEAFEMVRLIEQLNNDRPLLGRLKVNVAKYANTFFDPEKLGNEFLTQIGKVVPKQKKFFEQKLQWSEHVFPEKIYRWIKLFYHRWRYEK